MARTQTISIFRPLRGALAALALLAAACDEGGGPTGPGPRVPVAVVAVSPGEATLAVGATQPLAAQARAADGSVLEGRTIAWSSSDAAVATVSAAGTVTAVGAGVAVVSATSEGKRGEARIEVQALNPVPALTALAPRAVPAGGPGFTLAVAGAGFRPGARVYWNGTLRQTAYVSDAEVRALIPAELVAQVGTAEVKVANVGPGGGESAPLTFQVVVQPVPVAAVQVRPALSFTRAGSPVPLGATLRDAAGAPLEGRHVVWASSDSRVATVDGTGRVTAVGQGEARIVATSEGKSASAVIVVQGADTRWGLMFDGAGDGLYHLDLRLGGATRFWQHWPGAQLWDPSPAPDGRIAYTILQEGRTDLAVRYANGTYGFLTTGGVSDQAAFSPDGSRIAFRSSRGGRADVWVMDADGTDAVNLTAGGGGAAASGWPAWSPDGTRIAFTRRSAGGTSELVSMRADGTDKRSLVISSDHLADPTWAPGGIAVAFTRRDAANASDVWRIDADGTSLERLTRTGRAQMPAWSPDGGWIAYVNRVDPWSPGEIMAMRPFGSDARPLSLPGDAPRGGGMNPVWFRF